MNIIYNETNGKYDPYIDTGRGAWIKMSKTSLDALLQKYDNAYPSYTEGTRQELIDRWRFAEMIQFVTGDAPVTSQPGPATRAA